MKPGKLLYILLLFTGLLFISIQQWGCSREYSYEGGDTTTIIDSAITIDSTIVIDTAPAVTPIISCALCNETDDMKVGTWNFRNNQSYFCGTTTNTVFVENSGFTFFGPSACSTDTGLVITVYLSIPLDEDKYNVPADNVAFYYYDHNGNADMFIKLPPLPFSLTVNSYIKATGIATGTFGGIVYKPNGDTTLITNGRFMVKLQ